MKRAEKRAISVEEQRLKDKKKKVKDEKTKPEKSTDSSVLAVEQKEKTPKKVKATESIEKVAEKPKTVIANGNWICLKCKNNNFSDRWECNRCTEPRAVAVKAPVVAMPVAVIEPASHYMPQPKKTIFPVSKPKPIIVNNVAVKHKKYDWKAQASAEKIEENKLLVEIFTSSGVGGVAAAADGSDGSSVNSALASLTAEEIERAKVLLARKARKEAKKNKLALTKKIGKKKKGKKVVKAAASLVAKV